MKATHAVAFCISAWPGTGTGGSPASAPPAIQGGANGARQCRLSAGINTDGAPMKLQTLKSTLPRLGKPLQTLAPVNPDSWRAGKTTAERGYGGKWQRERARYLTSNQLCVQCDAMGITRAATVVDHITAHRGDMTLFWRRSNWQAVCKPCHDAKRESEER